MRLSKGLLALLLSLTTDNVVGFAVPERCSIIAPTTKCPQAPFAMTRLFATKEEDTTAASAAKEEDEPKKEKPTGHDVQSRMPKLSPEEMEALQRKQAALGEHQQAAPELDWPTQIRTLVQYNHGYAVMSTISKSDEGYPGGSVVGFVPDDVTGEPYFLFSGMSSHTQDLLSNEKCSVTVASKEFKGAADGRVNLMGSCQLVKDKEVKEKARSLYLEKHPNSAVWIDFGDFNWFNLKVEKIRFVGGFARAGSVSADEYRTAKPDVIAEFGAPIAKHMNDDHSSATMAICQQIPGLEEEAIVGADIVSVDSLGMYVKVSREEGIPKQFKIRVPFSRQAEDRGDVKKLIVELTQAAAAGAASPSNEDE